MAERTETVTGRRFTGYAKHSSMAPGDPMPGFFSRSKTSSRRSLPEPVTQPAPSPRTAPRPSAPAASLTPEQEQQRAAIAAARAAVRSAKGEAAAPDRAQSAAERRAAERAAIEKALAAEEAEQAELEAPTSGTTEPTTDATEAEPPRPVPASAAVRPEPTPAKPAGKKPPAKKPAAKKKPAGANAKKTTAAVKQAPDPNREPVVVVDDLHVRYKVFASGKAAGKESAKGLFKRSSRGLQEVHALKGISFTAYKNESIGVIGSNGSGKSTLLRTITGLTPPSEGSVWATSRPNLLGVGAALIPALSGNDNITLGCLALGFDRHEIEAARPEIIKFAELEKFIDFPMKTYSSGMSARLKFAIAAMKQHDILIVDEALAVGDAAFRKRSEAKIREIRENAGTVFLVSHSMKSIRDTCNRAIWIEKGEQKMDGTPDEVIKAYERSRATPPTAAAKKRAAAKKAAAAKKRAAAKKAAAKKRAAAGGA